MGRLVPIGIGRALVVFVVALVLLVLTADGFHSPFHGPSLIGLIFFVDPTMVGLFAGAGAVLGLVVLLASLVQRWSGSAWPAIVITALGFLGPALLMFTPVVRTKTPLSFGTAVVFVLLFCCALADLRAVSRRHEELAFFPRPARFR